MDLFHIQHDLIAYSTHEAWYEVRSEGTVFREQWEYGTGPDGTMLTVSSEHYSQLVHRDEPLLTCSWGMDADPHAFPLKFDWAEDLFDDEIVTRFWVDFFWAGSLIDRVTLLHVDGGRGIVPQPVRDKNVTVFDLAVAEMVHGFSGHDDDYAPVELARKLAFVEVRDTHRDGAGSH